MTETTRKRLRYSWLAGCLLLAAGVLLYPEGNVPNGASASPSTHTFTPVSSATLAAHDLVQPHTKPIEQIRVGDRVVGRNPLITEEERAHFTKVDQSTWKRVSLRMIKPNGGQLEAELLRPIEWLEAHGVEPGKTFRLDLAEMDAVGMADVLSVEECPPLPGNAGNVVTGTFTHSHAEELVYLRLDGTDESVEVTPQHLFFSDIHNEFVLSSELVPGERLRTSTGNVVYLASVDWSATEKPVFNLEVYGEHVFHVARAGVLVHNCSQASIGFLATTSSGDRFSVSVGSTVNRTATAARNSPGLASGGRSLAPPGNQWLTDGVAGFVPPSVAKALRGKRFSSFDRFREAFWKAVYEDSSLREQFSLANQTRLSEGKAPFAPSKWKHGKKTRYELHHIEKIEYGGAVYDLDNLIIVSPRTHKGIHDPQIFVPGYGPASGR